jgi:DNA-binding transcriptional MerR regulator
MDLMTIGEFARLSRLSPKALRIYDDSGLLAPARVDPASGYRWYVAEQLDQARLVASLRQIGVPLAQIKVILPLAPEPAAERVARYWAATEAEHGARRELAGRLVDRLTGKKSDMSEVEVRDLPERSLLRLIRHAHADDLLPIGKAFIARFRGAVPLLGGAAGAPFVIYHGEVNTDSDGPIEWCWPVPADQAGFSWSTRRTAGPARTSTSPCHCADPHCRVDLGALTRPCRPGADAHGKDAQRVTRGAGGARGGARNGRLLDQLGSVLTRA